MQKMTRFLHQASLVSLHPSGEGRVQETFLGLIKPNTPFHLNSLPPSLPDLSDCTYRSLPESSLYNNQLFNCKFPKSSGQSPFDLCCLLPRHSSLSLHLPGCGEGRKASPLSPGQAWSTQSTVNPATFPHWQKEAI